MKRSVKLTALFISIILCAAAASFVNADNIITTIAGKGTFGYSGDLGNATTAQLNVPIAIAIDASGNVYIADYGNNVIRKINTSGIISTIAGNGTAGYSGDLGSATTAELHNPSGVAVDASGNVYIADNANERIRKVDTSGIISTFAGNGSGGFSGDLGNATSAQLQSPFGVAVDTCGNVYIGDGFNNRVRKVNTSGIISTFAGNGTAGFSGDLGIATSAQLHDPDAVAVDVFGNVYIADNSNQRIRKVDTSGIISTFAGNGTIGFSGDLGTATTAQFHDPDGVGVDSSGNVYIADTFNSRIREVNALGIISTIAGNGTAGFSGDLGSATTAEIDYPYGVAVDVSGNVYIPDYLNNRVRKVLIHNYGTISGAVTISGGATAIQGASISALQSGTLIAQTISDSSGNYSFQLAVGTYSVTASLTGYVSQTSTAAVLSGQTATVNFALPATSSVQKSTGTIAGQVTNSAGAMALRGAIVLASQNGTTAAQAIANSSGNYSVQLATGTYSITVSSTGYVTQKQSGLVVTSGQATMANFALTATFGMVAGKVTKTDGNTAIPGVIVQALQNGTTAAQCISDTAGNYCIQLATGTYNITAYSTVYITQTRTNQVVSSGLTSAVNFELAAQTTAAANDLSAVLAYPSPFRLSALKKSISIRNLTADCDIKVFNVAGALIRTLNYSYGSGEAEWDVKNNSGRMVASGIYFICINSPAGKKVVKVAVEK